MTGAMRVVIGVVTAVTLVSSLAAQAPVTFDVVSVKPATPGELGASTIPGSDVFRARNVPTANLIEYAHGVRSYQVIGGPAWLRTERYTVVGRYPAGSQPSRVPQMVESTLVERFGLKTHRETREGDVYDLTMVRDDREFGPRIAHGG